MGVCSSRSLVRCNCCRPAGRLHLDRRAPSDEIAQWLALRYAEASQSAGMDRLIPLPRNDVILTMPPLPLRFTCHQAVVNFFSAIPLRAARRFP